MTVNPGAGAIEGHTELMVAPATLEKLARAYIATYHGPHGDAPVADAVTGPVDMSAAGKLMSPNLLSAHYRLGRRRQAGETLVEVYPSNDPGGFGPAIQIVTDHATLLMDSVTVLLHRLGVAYKAIMNPILRVRRDPSGELRDIQPAAEADKSRNAVDEAWIHVQLSKSVDPKAVEEVRRLLPSVMADARQVALDSRALTGTLLGLANELDTDPEGRFPSDDRKDVAALLRWLADGHFVLLGYQRCPVSGGEATVDTSSRLGILRFRDDILPQLTDNGDLLVLAQATIPSFLRYGAYPYIVVIREHPGHQAIEHRFCGLFTVAAMNANVMDIPLISRRVSEAITMAQRDPSHPAQLLLDIIQTIPRSELFALSAQQLLDMAMGVVDLGSRRRTLLFLRADQLAHFVSCLVYLPRDRYTTVVRLEMQDILVRELGRRRHRVHRPGQRIAMGGRAFHRPAARGVASAGYRRVPWQRGAHSGSAYRGGADVGRPTARRRQDRIDRPGQGRALLGGVPRGLQAGSHPR